ISRGRDALQSSAALFHVHDEAGTRWSVTHPTPNCSVPGFIVPYANGQALAYVYCHGNAFGHDQISWMGALVTTLNAAANKRPRPPFLNPGPNRLNSVVGDVVDTDILFNLVDSPLIHNIDPFLRRRGDAGPVRRPVGGGKEGT